MAICPFDAQPCIDDLCHGSGCLRMGFAPMLVPCSGGCGAYVAIDGSDDCDLGCDCEPVYVDDDIGMDEGDIPY